MIKSACELEGKEEVCDLKKGMDFRKIEYRKEVFFRFYKFHTMYEIHPGLVYLYLPELAIRDNWDTEQRYWAAFLEGCTENPCTVWHITRFFPRLPRTQEELKNFDNWHSKNWKNLFYDRDVRYNKGYLVAQVQSYIDHLKNMSQETFFTEYLYDKDCKKWFDKIWEETKSFYKFGRLTTFSYVEFIKILTGLPYEYSSLMMNDLHGSKSHRNGLLRVLGRDDLDWWEGANNGVKTHSKELCEDLEIIGQHLTEELKDRYKYLSWSKYIGYQTVESALCAYKNCFHGERYPNIYTDMSYDRIKKAEAFVKDVDFSIFWKIRETKLPEKLLLEKNPRDPGLVPLKQEWFKNTGELPMMSEMDSVFEGQWDYKFYGDEVDAFF